MSDTKDARPTAAFHDELMIVAETVGEIRDRLSKIETEFETQARPLTAAKDTQDAALAALNAALTGIRALNFHVLDNNLGEVSKRVESLSGELAKRATELAASIEATRAELSRTATDHATKFARVSTERTELAKRTDAQRSELAATIAEVRTELANAQTELASRIQTAITQFATPATLDPQGAWDAMTTYKKLAMVELNGTSYVSNVDDNRTKPGRRERSWTLVARRGAAGTGGGISDVTGIAGMGATGLQIAQAGTPEEVRTIVGVEDFDGATADDDGTAGRVPQPVAGDQNKYLRADGTWTTPSSVTAPAATQATVDAGLVDDEFVSPLTLRGNVAPQLAARSRAGRIISDGVTPNRRVQLTSGDVGAVGGLPVSVLMEWTCPTANPSAICTLWSLQTGPGAATSAEKGFGLLMNTSGELQLLQWTGYTAQVRRYIYAGYRAARAGMWERISVCVPNPDSTDKPIITRNEVDISGDFIAANAGSPLPTFLPASGFVPTHFLSGYNAPAGDMPRVLYGIGAMSTDEVAAWHRDGTLPAWMERPGSAVSILVDSTRNGDFSAGATDWIPVGTATASVVSGALNVASVSGTAGARFANSGAVIKSASGTATDGQALSGRVMIVRFTLSNVTSSVSLNNVAGGNTTFQNFASGLGNGTHYVMAGPFNYDGANVPAFGLVTSAGNSFTVDDFDAHYAGLLDKPVVQAALATSDQLGRFSRLIVGGLPVPAEGNSNGGTIYGSGTWAGTHEAKDIVGGTVFDSSMPCIVEAVTLAASASSSGTGPTVGNTNDPDQYVIAAAITGGTPKHFGTAALADVFNGGTAANDRNLVIDPDSANYTGTIKATVKFSRVNI